MTAPTTPSSTDPPPRRWLAAAGAALVLFAAAGAWLALELRAAVSELTARVADLDRRAARVEEVLHLIRIERGTEGLGATALLEHFDYWAPMLQNAGTPQPEIAVIKGRLEDAVTAVGALGAGAFDRLYSALEESDHDEVRKWLIFACLRADPARGKQLLADVVRGTRLSPSARLRFAAADELLELDKPLCGAVLKDVLLVESHQGVTREVPPHLRRDYEEMTRGNRFPSFFNFIPRYAATEHPDVENVLLMILGRPEHDLLTYKECIRLLGDLGSRDAVARIKELYENPPGLQLDPFLQIHCLEALRKILGKDACPFFHKAIRSSTMDNVRAKLQQLIKENCG